MKKLLGYTCRGYNALSYGLDWLASIAMLANRIYLAKVFMWSGWLKITSWSTTVYMFANDFKTGPLSPEVAAYLGTTLEIVLPLLLLLGIGTRLSALALFIFNIVSVLSYPILLSPEYVCALKDHIIWGILILIPVLYGPGFLSLDCLLQKKVCKEYHY